VRTAEVTYAPDTPEPSPLDERYNVAGADILDYDTWADEPDACPNCGTAVDSGRAQCPECGQWLERCGRSCASCASPTCVGGGREDAK